MKLPLIIVLVFVFAHGVLCANKTIHYANGLFNITATGNGTAPKYTFHSHSDPNDTYSIQFDSLYECRIGHSENCNGKLGNVALASLNWAWSNLTNVTGGAYFDIVGTGVANFASLTIRNHLRNDTASLKFDLNISSYKWESTGSLAKLVFTFVRTGVSDKDFFTIIGSANDGAVAVTLDDQGNKKYITYSRFPSDLVHDPEFGIASNVTSTSDAPSVSVPHVLFWFPLLLIVQLFA